MHINVWGYMEILPELLLIIVLCALHASAQIQKAGKYFSCVIHYNKFTFVSIVEQNKTFKRYQPWVLP